MARRTVEVELSTSGLDARGRPQRVPLVTNDGGTAVAIAPPGAVAPGTALAVTSGAVVCAAPASGSSDAPSASSAAIAMGTIEIFIGLLDTKACAFQAVSFPACGRVNRAALPGRKPGVSQPRGERLVRR